MKTTWLQRVIARIKGRDLEAEYWEWLRQFGRITEGRILELNQEEGGGSSVYYRYTLANVAYETSHILTAEQLAKAHKYVPGASVTVRFDPKNPGSAMVE